MIRSPLMTIMVDAVMKAAKGLRRDFGEVENLQVSRKGPGDFVSAADHKAEQVIRELLLKSRPDFGFVMEESGIVVGKDASHRWHIDPLDGTTNFLHGLPHFAISLGLERDGVIVAGVIYDPAKDELFIAERGKGAFINNKRMRVAQRSDVLDARVRDRHPQHRAARPSRLPQAARAGDDEDVGRTPHGRRRARSRLRRRGPLRRHIGSRG